MNCIFVCIFADEKYVDMFYLLLESIFIYGNLDDNTHILVYTSTNFMNRIKKSHLFNEKIVFEINDSYNNTDLACKSRLNLFNLQSTANYDKILYLDTDIIVHGDINTVFNVITDDILYAVEEGIIDGPCDFWGSTLFGEEVHNYTDKTAFSSSMLLFNNCEKIKNLFNEIIQDINIRPHYFHDQPHIVYNAFKYNCYNNKQLIPYACNCNADANNNKTLYHFAGGPGAWPSKIYGMTNFLNELKEHTITENINKTKEFINAYLLPIIHNCGELLEGNIFMMHHSTEYTDFFINKTKNLSNMVLNKNIKNVMEIGFNSGFSTLLMLISNPNMNITCVDLAEHNYTFPCYQKIREIYGDRMNIIVGDSTKTLENINKKFDLIHIDGGHSTEVAESDIINSYRLSKQGTVLIMDDYDFGHLHELWDGYIIKYNLKPLNINVYDSPHHDIKYVEK